jgi:hypothetical protein
MALHHITEQEVAHSPRHDNVKSYSVQKLAADSGDRGSTPGWADIFPTATSFLSIGYRVFFFLGEKW